MGHLVQYRTAAGEPASHEVDELEEALALAARLRNDERAEDVRVFTEVPLRFETYVKVSVASTDEDVVEHPTAEPDLPEASLAPAVEAAVDERATVEPPPGAMPLTPASLGRAPRMFQGS